MGKYCEYLECIDLVKACEKIDRTGYAKIKGIPATTELNINSYIRQLITLSKTPPNETIESLHFQNLKHISKSNRKIEIEERKPRYNKEDYIQAGIFFKKTLESYFEHWNGKTIIQREIRKDLILDDLYRNTGSLPESDAEFVAFIIYHYDLVIWFCKKGKAAEALASYEAVNAATEWRGILSGRHFGSHYERMKKATQSANARHAHTNKQKEEALKLWDETRQNYSSINGFSDTNCRKFDVKSRALARWISEHERAKRDD